MNLHIPPYTIAIDTREQAPFVFRNLIADSKQKNIPIVVHTKVQTLQTGDYSIVGYEDRITVERKSIPDFITTLTTNHERFRREIVRMQEMESSHIVVEGEWSAILQECKLLRLAHPKSLTRTEVSWSIKYPKTHWHFCPSRDHAMRWTFHLLNSWFEQRGE